MHFALPLVLLSGVASAIPKASTERIPRRIPKDPLDQPDHFSMCRASINCDIQQDPLTGKKKMKFHEGMEPGTRIFELTELMNGDPRDRYYSHPWKRRSNQKYEDFSNDLAGLHNHSNPDVRNWARGLSKSTGTIHNSKPQVTSHMAFGNGKVEFGCQSNVNVSAMLGNLTKLCKDDTCLSQNTVQIPIMYAAPNSTDEPTSATWELSADGQYATNDLKYMIQGIQVMGQKATKHWTQSWEEDDTDSYSIYNDDGTGSCEMWLGSDEYNLLRTGKMIDGTAATRAIISALPSVSTTSQNFCKDIFVTIGAQVIAGLIPEVGGILSAILGGVTTACLADTELSGDS